MYKPIKTYYFLTENLLWGIFLNKLQGAGRLNREVGENPTRSRRCEGRRKPYPPIGGEKATVR